jgi:germination protein M
MRAHARYLLLAIVLLLGGGLALVVASCGAEDEAVSAGPVPSTPGEREDTTIDATTAQTTEEPSPTETQASLREITYEVWFQRTEMRSGVAEPTLHVVHRTRAATEAIGAAAVTDLLAGPTDREETGDVATGVPAGTQLLGLDIGGGVATVDLSSEFESGGGSLSMQMRLAQVVYTLTQFPTVDGVRFHLDGEPVEVFSGEGIILDHPVTRADYEELLPAIQVESPAVWAEVGNPVIVRGTANVFEANVTVRILLPDGTEIGRTFTTAACGTGCRGAFSASLRYGAHAERSAVLAVSDDDAAGRGVPPHEVRIPILLRP